MRSHKWLVGITGGSGFIGSSLVNYLARLFDIRILDISPPKQKFGGNVSFQVCDIGDFEELKRSLQDVDLVIHTAIVQIPLINEDKRLAYRVNFLGTQNVCEVVDKSQNIKGMILAGSWHTIGERELRGVINEEFGFRPDKVEERARLYALAKIAQEAIVRFYDEMSDKTFGIIRMGTVLGDNMPEKTAANIFIDNGLKGKPLTPFKNSMFRPMLYVNIEDSCQAYEIFARRILTSEPKKIANSLDHVFNLFYPEPITILELAETVRETIMKCSDGRIEPKIEVVDTGYPSLFGEEEKKLIKVDISKALRYLGFQGLRSPKESIEQIVKMRINRVPL